MTNTTSVIPRIAATLMALLLGAGLFAWMNATGDALNNAFGIDAIRPATIFLAVFGPNASGFGSAEGWPIPGASFGRGGIVFVLLAGVVGGALAIRNRTRRDTLMRKRESRYSRLRRNILGLRPLITPARLAGFIAAACLAAIFVFCALGASRVYGTEHVGALDRSADMAALAAARHYEFHGQLPVSLPGLPQGHRYRDVDGSLIEYCVSHAFGEHCTFRQTWGENGAFEIVENPFGLSHPLWRPQDNVTLLLLWGMLAAVMGKMSGPGRSVTKSSM
jgi:hypothetical protein